MEERAVKILFQTDDNFNSRAKPGGLVSFYKYTSLVVKKENGKTTELLSNTITHQSRAM